MLFDLGPTFMFVSDKCTDVYPGASLLKNRENSGKLGENSVTSGNVCGC